MSPFAPAPSASGRGRSLAALTVAGGLAAAAMLPARAVAQITLIESESVSLDLTGYVRTLTGLTDLGYELPDGDRRSGFHSGVLRLKWRARFGESLVLDVHDRIQVGVSSSSGAFGGSAVGFGVSADPGRLVDLETVWLDEDGVRASHDIDRLALTAFTPVADVTVGRQAITWGTSLLFPVADLWARFSPFELDTEEKPGIDAVRALGYPASNVEVDAVLADRGDRDAVSAGVRATWSLASVDLYGAVGRVWEEAMILGGGTWLFDTWKLRVEGALARDQDAGRWLDPRATVGVDWLGSRFSVTVELHRNGPGAASADGYVAELQSERFARGESYFLGRSYLGGVASWAVDSQERFRLVGTALVNLDDPSGALLPALTWNLGQATNLSLGGLVALGDTPVFGGLVPVLRSEYGTYGNLLYGQVSVYF